MSLDHCSKSRCVGDGYNAVARRHYGQLRVDTCRTATVGYSAWSNAIIPRGRRVAVLPHVGSLRGKRGEGERSVQVQVSLVYTG